MNIIKKNFNTYWFPLLVMIIVIVVPNQRGFYLKDVFKNFKPIAQLIFLLFLVVFFAIKLWLDFKNIKRFRWSLQRTFVIIIMGAIIVGIYYFVCQDVFTNFCLFINRQTAGSKISKNYRVMNDSPFLFDLNKQQYSNEPKLLDSVYKYNLYPNDTFKVILSRGLLGVYYFNSIQVK